MTVVPLCLIGLVLVIVPAYLLKRGLDATLGCVGRLITLVIVGVMLLITLNVLGVHPCEIWQIGAPLCGWMENIQTMFAP